MGNRKLCTIANSNDGRNRKGARRDKIPGEEAMCDKAPVSRYHSEALGGG